MDFIAISDRSVRPFHNVLPENASGANRGVREDMANMLNFGVGTDFNIRIDNRRTVCEEISLFDTSGLLGLCSMSADKRPKSIALEFPR